MRMPSRDDMIAMSVSNSASAYKGYFSATRDFSDGLATEADNVKFAKDQQQEIKVQQQENEKKAEEQRDGVSAANSSFKDYQEEQENKMREINGRQFSDADLEETINEIIEDKEAFQKKHNLTDEEADIALNHAVAMKAMTRDERVEYLTKLRETDPEIANTLIDDITEFHANKSENKNDSPKQENMTAQEQEIAENKLDDLDDLDAMLTGIEDTQLVQESYADGMEAIKKSNLGQSSQDPQQVAEINEVEPVTPKGMTLG